jgi:hypothetical protein
MDVFVMAMEGDILIAVSFFLLLVVAEAASWVHGPAYKLIFFGQE